MFTARIEPRAVDKISIPQTNPPQEHCFKYIVQSNERLKQENDCLKQMTNYVTVQNIETQNKIKTLEDYNNRLIELIKIQKEANDFQQQKIEVMESQITLLNRQVTDGPLQPTQPKDYDKSEFSKALALACSIKIDKVKSEVADEDKFCELE
ncbi:hypothetical protein RclHR1_09630008 [Rhizophagus clarus]|uniref:Uncharacterized protein n=1 Tax=Rhizophagus clarus TaxID=94130 RepID=A0A2Z6S528_9GLOM|nr:hypothetical protein RclHR1_09630008 [Rhizophagus clarus]